MDAFFCAHVARVSCPRSAHAGRVSILDVKGEWGVIRFNHPSPRVQRKMEALYLKALGFRHKTICRICRISSVTLVEYLREYQEGGIECLKLNLHKGKKSELLEYEESLELILNQNPPQSTKQAAAIIMSHTGVKRGSTQVREFLKHLGFKYRKTATNIRFQVCPKNGGSTFEKLWRNAR
ncbi:MAG: hypothetical protein EOL87_18675 [Spartobacteria bacterium]|nr:hypothetical protein [Spartobacteria bacterium]